MPLYHYRCERCDTQLELLRAVTDKENVFCDGCGTALKKMPAAIALTTRRSEMMVPTASKGACGGGGGG